MDQSKRLTVEEGLLLFCQDMQTMADSHLIALNGRDEPMLDGRPGREFVSTGSAIEFWTLWKEHWVNEAKSLRPPTDTLPPF
ncbi:MAG TPA: hypothetical protein VLL94_08890 [Nitrospiraceae bacterium]|nr:hypothetical protein [Nitrospiraceae bacterium]